MEHKSSSSCRLCVGEVLPSGTVNAVFILYLPLGWLKTDLVRPWHDLTDVSLYGQLNKNSLYPLYKLQKRNTHVLIILSQNSCFYLRFSAGSGKTGFKIGRICVYLRTKCEEIPKSSTTELIGHLQGLDCFWRASKGIARTQSKNIGNVERCTVEPHCRSRCWDLCWTRIFSSKLSISLIASECPTKLW